jgi:Leucine-rich repeat (LRR) protein
MRTSSSSSSSTAALLQLPLLMMLMMILMHGCSVVRCQKTICPSICSRNMDATHVYEMQCQQLGAVDQVPPTCNDTREIKVLTIGPDGTSIATIQQGAFNGLRVVQLVLEKLSIRDLDSNAFAGLAMYIEVLYLNDNLIHQLPTGIFSGLTKLTNLQLHSNRLSSLWSSAPSNPLTSLPPPPSNDAGNRSSSSSSSALAPLISLKRLTLYDNQISNISNELFALLRNLEDLSLDRNRIQTLSVDVFANVANLKTLTMSSNEIVFLPDYLFASCRSIETIDFSANRISAISPNTFTNLTKLEKLSLNDNELRELKNDYFLGLVNLQTIRLDNNSISHVDSNGLTGMPLLTQLHLQNNNIRVLPIGLFDPVGSLILLNLSSNLISRVEKMPFSSQGNLVQLDLSNNTLEDIPADWFPYTRSLKILRLDYNQIESINSSSFDQCSTLTEINLRSNRLSEVQLRGLFAKCMSLQSLRIDENPLEHVTPETFGGLPSLTRLYLNSSCLRNISFDWRPESLPLLQELYLQNNFIERISATDVIGLTQLRTLDVAFNDISVIDETAFAAASSNLLLLNLTRNQMNSSQAASLSSNKFRQTTVDLSWNQIKDLENFPIFRSIYLSGNPIVCKCSMFNDLVDLSSFADFDATICSSSVESSEERIDSMMTMSSADNNSMTLLVCYIFNQTVCSNRTTIELPNQLCQSKVIDYTEISSKNRDRRLKEIARCPSMLTTSDNGIIENKTTTTTTPQQHASVAYVDATAFETRMNITWTVADMSPEVMGFVVTCENQKSGNVTSYLISNANQTSLMVQWKKDDNYTICVQIVQQQQQQQQVMPSSSPPPLKNNATTSSSSSSSSSSYSLGNRKCVDFDRCRYDVNSGRKKDENNSLYPLILCIIIPVAVVVIIIVAVVIIIVVRQKRLANAKEAMRQASNARPSNYDDIMSPTISKGTSMGLAEQATVSVNIFNY